MIMEWPSFRTTSQVNKQTLYLYIVLTKPLPYPLDHW